MAEVMKFDDFREEGSEAAVKVCCLGCNTYVPLQKNSCRCMSVRKNQSVV